MLLWQYDSVTAFSIQQEKGREGTTALPACIPMTELHQSGNKLCLTWEKKSSEPWRLRGNEHLYLIHFISPLRSFPSPSGLRTKLVKYCLLTCFFFFFFKPPQLVCISYLSLQMERRKPTTQGGFSSQFRACKFIQLVESWYLCVSLKYILALIEA